MSRAVDRRGWTRRGATVSVPESFRTERLEGERLGREHLADLRALHRDPETMAELGGVRSDAETSRYLSRNLDHWATYGFGVWMLRLEGGDRSIGRVVLRWLATEHIDDVEIGFAFFPAYWGRGLATESGKFCIDVARRHLGLKTVVGITTPENHASQRVLQKLGLSYECETVVEQTRCFQYRVRW